MSLSSFPRTLLLVPAHRPQMLPHAWDSGAEALVLDLEDSVPRGDKAAARDAVTRLSPPDGWSRPIYVRVNAYGTDDFLNDARAIARRPVAGVVLPKAERAHRVLRAADALGSDRGLVLLVETAAGVLHTAELADGRIPGLVAFAFGAEDYRASMDAGLSPDSALFDHARVAIATAAAAAGVPAIDAPELDVADLDGLRAATRRARGLGFRAKFAIHSSQVPVIHDALGDSGTERAWAARVIEAYNRAAAEGRGAVSLDGRMIDAATVRRARALARRDT